MKLSSHWAKIAGIMLVCFIATLLSPACSLTEEAELVRVTPTTTFNIGDGDFLSGKFCAPPCFFGIVPGQTTKEDALEMLRINKLGQGCTEFDNSEGGGIRGFVCDSAVFTLQNESDIVTAIGFDPSPRFTVAEAIAKYGEPNAVLVGVIGPTEIRIGMSLYYDSNQVILGLVSQDSTAFELVPDTLVSGVSYYDSNSYQVNRKHYYQNWAGYGVYEEGSN